METFILFKIIVINSFIPENNTKKKYIKLT